MFWLPAAVELAQFAGDGYVQPCLFFDLANGGFGQRLALFHAPARHHVVVAAIFVAPH